MWPTEWVCVWCNASWGRSNRSPHIVLHPSVTAFTDKRPRVTFRQRVLAAFFFILGLANLVRAGMIPYVASVLADWPLTVPLSLLGGVYVLWGILFVVLSVLLWRGGGRRPALPAAVGYQLTLWLLHGLAYASTYARELWPRDVALTAGFLLSVALLLWRRR